MTRSAASATKNAARMKRRYHERKARRVCVNCQAGLEEGQTAYCVECQEKHQESKDTHALTHRDAINERAATKAREKYRADPVAAAAAKKAERDARVQAGKCYFCPADALADSNFCEKHRDKNRLASRERARIKSGFYERYPNVKPGEVIRPRDRARTPSASQDPSTPPDESAPASGS